MKTKVTAKIAISIRIQEIERLSGINCNVAPTSGIDSGAKGKVFEYENAREDSTKTCISKPNLPDNYMRIRDENDKEKTIRFESKTNGGEITSIVKALERGKDGIIVYRLDVCNNNTNHVRRYVHPRIMRYSTFVAGLESCGAIRWEKRFSDGHIGQAIEPTKKALPAFLESQTEFYVNEVYGIEEIM